MKRARRSRRDRAEWLGVACSFAAISCTGDAFLGAEPISTHAPVAPQDAGVDSAPPTSAGGSGAPPAAMSDAGTSTDAVSAPLTLAFLGGGSPVTELAVMCPDTCGEVELAASGGKPPYTFSWEDSTTTATRMVCSSADTLKATVRDAHGDEHSATLPVRHVPCNIGHVCADNASFEGSPTRGAEWLTTSQLGAAPWEDCRATGSSTAANLPRIVDLTSGDEFPTASDGNTYVYLPSRADMHGAVAQTLCEPLTRGSAYAFKIDLAYAAEDRTGVPIEPGRVEVYASSGNCQRDSLVWTSPALRTAWRTYCITFQPRETASALLFSAIGPANAEAAVFVDHLVPVTSCP